MKLLPFVGSSLSRADRARIVCVEMNWYYSDVHRKLMNGFSSGGRRPEGPLAGITDDSGPILTIASITMDPVAMKNGDLKGATRQIAIELHAPLAAASSAISRPHETAASAVG